MPSQIRPNPASLADRLRDIVDPGRVLDGAGTAKDGPLAIRGLEAPLQVRPAHAAQMGSVLALAQSERLGVCIAGGATKLQWGNRPERFDLLVGTGGLCSTSAVDADDLTMTVSAGVTLAQARAQARAMDRVLPLDGGRPSLATSSPVIALSPLGLPASWGSLPASPNATRAFLSTACPPKPPTVYWRMSRPCPAPRAAPTEPRNLTAEGNVHASSDRR